MKIISCVLAVAMLLCIFPVVVFAEQFEAVPMQYALTAESLTIQMLSGFSKEKPFCYSTQNKNEILMLTQLINDIEIYDDGVSYYGSDSAILYIDYKYQNSERYIISVEHILDPWKMKINGKQYSINHDDYDVFREYVLALMDERISYSDMTVSISNWAKEYVEKATRNGILQNRHLLNFKSSIMRYEFCEIASAILPDSDNEVSKVFEDTINPCVEKLYVAGVVSGNGDGNFYPFNMITREEAAVILGKIFQNLCKDQVPYYVVTEKNDFSDDSSISDWAKDSAKLLNSYGILVGNENNEFCPKDTMTKEQAIAAVVRIFEMFDHDSILNSYDEYIVGSSEYTCKDESGNETCKISLLRKSGGIEGYGFSDEHLVKIVPSVPDMIADDLHIYADVEIDGVEWLLKYNSHSSNGTLEYSWQPGQELFRISDRAGAKGEFVIQNGFDVKNWTN